MAQRSTGTRWVSQRTQAALGIATASTDAAPEELPRPEVVTSAGGIAHGVSSLHCSTPPQPSPEPRVAVLSRATTDSVSDPLWARLQLALNQLTTAQVDHYATNSATGSTRPDFLLIPVLYPLHARHVALQQRMMQYFVCFPLPRPAAASNKVFVSVFIDSYEALGGDAEFAFWFLLARLIPPLNQQEGEGELWTPTVAELWNSLSFLRDLEPNLLWPLCPPPDVEALYNAHLAMEKPTTSANKEAALLLLADLATRGAYTATVLFEAMARHPTSLGEAMMPIVWVQVTASLVTQLQMRNRRMDWTARDSARREREPAAEDTLEQRAAFDDVEDDVLASMEGLLAMGGNDALQHQRDAKQVHVMAAHDVEEGQVDESTWCNEAGYLLDPNPARRKVMIAFVQTLGFRIGLYRHNGLVSFSHTSLRRGADADASLALKLITTPQHADLVTHIHDYHLMLVLTKAGLSFDVAHSIIDQYVFVGSRSIKQGALRMYLSTHNEKLVPQVAKLLGLL
jgi:hypothetical protein